MSGLSVPASATPTLFPYIIQFVVFVIIIERIDATTSGYLGQLCLAANINARIADGVIAANVTGSVPSNYASAIGALAPSLTSTCP